MDIGYILNDRKTETVVFFESYISPLSLHNQVDKLSAYIFIEKDKDGATYTVAINIAVCTKRDDDCLLDYFRCACL